MEPLETIRWREGKIRILDQTRLPREETYRDLSTAEEVCEAVRTLAVRGAPAIGVTGAMGVALAARLAPRESADAFLGEVRRAAAALAGARPTAVNLRWGVERVLAVIERGMATIDAGDRIEATDQIEARDPIEAVVREALREAQRILEEDLALSRAMAEHGAPLLPENGRVITHCNTGGLATAGGGTALGLVLEAARLGKRLFVYVDETRPLLQGARLTAWELRRAGVPFAVQCDGASAWRMKTERIDAVLVGADRVAANGDTANKVGTFALALAAREFSVPFYVVAPRSSFDLTLPDGDTIPIETRAAEEVLFWGGTRVAPEEAGAWNPAFDVTPARLITAWVTERGLEQPPFAA